MKKVCTAVIILLLTVGVSIGQTVKLSCTEKKRKNEDGKYPILVKTCFIKNFKFVTISRPDYVGRYFFQEYEVYVKTNNKYVSTKNSNVFNEKQSKLLDIVNARILEDFISFRSDSSTKSCFDGIDSIPTYKMDEIDITFSDDKIWFVVQWGLPTPCRAVDGTLIIFKIDEIKQYLN